MMPDFYPLAVVLIYASFLALAADLFIEPELKTLKAGRFFILVVLLGGAVWFTAKIPLADRRLLVTALENNADIDAGTKVAGIPWNPHFTELDVRIQNPTDNPYENLAVLIRPDAAVAAITQRSAVPNVWFSDKDQIQTHLAEYNANRGISKNISLDLLATDAGYIIHCQHLSGGATIEVVLALADIKWDPHPRPPGESVADAARDGDYVERVHIMDDFASYWEGHPGGDVYAPRPTGTEAIIVDANYAAGHMRVSWKRRITAAALFMPQ